MNTATRRMDTPVALNMFKNFDKNSGGIFSPQRGRSDQHSMLNLAIDVVEKETAYEIKADIPGVNKDDINVTVDDGVLTIVAESQSGKQLASQGKVIRSERRYGKFSRSLRLGEDVNDKSIQANYNDGVLTLTLAKVEQAQPKKITINA